MINITWISSSLWVRFNSAFKRAISILSALTVSVPGSLSLPFEAAFTQFLRRCCSTKPGRGQPPQSTGPALPFQRQVPCTLGCMPALESSSLFSTSITFILRYPWWAKNEGNLTIKTPWHDQSLFDHPQTQRQLQQHVRLKCDYSAGAK